MPVRGQAEVWVWAPLTKQWEEKSTKPKKSWCLSLALLLLAGAVTAMARVVPAFSLLLGNTKPICQQLARLNPMNMKIFCSFYVQHHIKREIHFSITWSFVTDHSTLGFYVQIHIFKPSRLK